MNARISSVPAIMTVLVLAAAPVAASAQWAMEGRVGSALPSGELTRDSGLNQTAGVSFAADATYGFNESVSVYGGLARQSFNCAGCTRSVSSTGFDSGVKLRLTTSGSAEPWVRGGLMLHQPQVDGDERDWGLGFGSAVGVDWLLNPRFSVVPALRLSSYNSGSMSLTYVTLDAGVHVRM